MHTTQSKFSLKKVLLNIEINNNINEALYGQIVFFIDALTKNRKALFLKANRLENSIENLQKMLKKKSTSHSHYYKLITTNNYMRGMHASLSKFYIHIQTLDKIIHKLKKFNLI